MKNFVLSFIILIVSAFGAFAQGNFKVLSAKGDNVVQKGGNYVPLGPGTQLPANAKIMIGEGGVVELTNATNQTVTLDKPGIYSMNDVAGDFKIDNSSVAQRYLAYVFNEMQDKSDSRTANLAITGSVERSLKDEAISIYCPESTYIMSKETSFKWTAKKPSESYKVVVRNLFDEEVIATVVEGTSASLDLSKIEFEEDAIYKFSVVDTKNPSNKSGELILRIPTKVESAHITNDLKELEKDSDQSSPLYYALLAKYYKVNGLYADAVQHFEKAIELAPDSEMIKMEYDAFLKDAGVQLQ